jgi:hypothetical protein
MRIVIIIIVVVVPIAATATRAKEISQGNGLLVTIS